MGDRKQEEQDLFIRQLRQLIKANYISQDIYTRVAEGYRRYQRDQKEQTLESGEEREVQSSTDGQKIDDKSKITSGNVKLPEKRVLVKKKTPEEVREQKITWSLIMGVLMILISGLFVATNNWERYSPGVKTSFNAIVALFFFIISWVSQRFLQIKKTSFAFLVLGGLFVPIFFLSIGYYRLLGEWLSLFGGGKFWFGALSALVCLPIYFYLARRYNSRIFVWFSYLTLTLLFAFILMGTQLPLDAFYFGMILFNGLLLYLYYRYGKQGRMPLFTKELPAFAQMNLVISTLLMLMLFNSPVFYSVNVILTAFLYMWMIFVYQRKEYSFVFILLLAYGLYQLIEHTALQHLDFLLFSLVGILYLYFERIFEEGFLKRLFHYTSAVVSFFAFIYISVQGFLLRYEHSSTLLLLAYLALTLNYLLLTNLTRKSFFAYLTSIFLFVSGYQVYNLLLSIYPQEWLELFLFLYAFLIFWVFSMRNMHRWTMPIKESSLAVALIVMLGAIVLAFFNEKWFTLPILLFAYGGVWGRLVQAQEGSLRKIGLVMNPLTWLLGFWSIYLSLQARDIWPFYTAYLRIPSHFAIIGLILFMVQWGWRRLKQGALARNTFYAGQLSYTMSLLLILRGLFAYEMNHLVVEDGYIRTGILLLGCFVYTSLVQVTRYQPLWNLVSMTALCFYISLLAVLNLVQDEAVFGVLFLPVFLLLIEWIGEKKYPELRRYFFGLVHVIQPIIILLTLILFAFAPFHPRVYLIPLGVYLYSLWRAQGIFSGYFFLYGAFTMVPILLLTTVMYYDLQMDEAWIFPLTSLVLGLTWFFMKGPWRRRTEIYLIPFSFFGLMIWNGSMSPATWWAGLLSLGYTIFILRFLHGRKLDIFNAFPLALMLIYWLESQAFSSQVTLWIGYALFLGFVGAGKYLYTYLVQFEAGKLPRLDWYTFFSLLYLATTLNEVDADASLLLQLLTPTLLVGALFLQIPRWSQPLAQKIMTTIAGLSLLYPYYVLLGNLQIPVVIQTELYTLPWLVLQIVLSKKIWSHHQKIMQKIQLALLMVIAIILLLDTLQSDTLSDALLLGGLALLSILVGLYSRTKSYFFVGSVVLMLNLFIQTEPFWGRLPWWAYLLMAGFILVVGASFYEWQRQKKKRDYGG